MSREEDKLIGQIDAKIVRAKRRKKKFEAKSGHFFSNPIRFWRHPLLQEIWGLNEEVRLQELAEKELLEIDQW